MLAGFASNPWDYSQSPKPRADGGAGKPPASNTAVTNVLQASDPVPFGQSYDRPIADQMKPFETTDGVGTLRRDDLDAPPPMPTGFIAPNDQLAELLRILSSKGGLPAQPQF